MRRRKVKHGNHSRRQGRRSEKYRAWHKEEPVATVCPHCRRATWPTRQAAKDGMRTATARPDWSCPPGFVTVAYPCPDGHGWHWRVTAEGSRSEQAS